MSDRVEIVFGPPGTGKTTALLSEVDQFLSGGGDPARVGFVSFTRQAAREAQSRAMAQFGFPEEALPHFRTLHSAAFRALGLTRRDVLTATHYAEIAQSVGLPLVGTYGQDTEYVGAGGALGDAALRCYAMARARGTPLEDEWRRSEERALTWDMVRLFTAALSDFKRARGLLDFADMLDQCDVALPLDLLIVDEAQDLSWAQWALVRRLSARTPRIVVGGDDDQAIFDWAGAAPDILLRLAGARRILPVSHRLPAAVHAVAQRISSQIAQRADKPFQPRGPGGAVQTISDLEALDPAEGTWLVIARHQRQLAAVERWARRAGVVYHHQGAWSTEAPAVRAAIGYERLRKGLRLSPVDAQRVVERVIGAHVIGAAPDGTIGWTDIQWPWAGDRPDWMTALGRLSEDEREYLRAVRRRGESLTGPGRVRLSTIHGAKGAEADTVVVLTDVTKTVHRALWTDAEWRVWYVAVTRARESLLLVQPRSVRHWQGLSLLANAH